MSSKQLVQLASRAFALYLTAWALDDVTLLPGHLFSLSQYMNHRSVLTTHDYWTTYYLILTGSNLLRILALSLAAALFWRCGPWVQALFSPPQENQQPTVDPS